MDADDGTGPEGDFRGNGHQIGYGTGGFATNWLPTQYGFPVLQCLYGDCEGDV